MKLNRGILYLISIFATGLVDLGGCLGSGVLEYDDLGLHLLDCDGLDEFKLDSLVSAGEKLLLIVTFEFELEVLDLALKSFELEFESLNTSLGRTRATIFGQLLWRGN